LYNFEYVSGSIDCITKVYVNCPLQTLGIKEIVTCAWWYAFALSVLLHWWLAPAPSTLLQGDKVRQPGSQ